jgi:hypothetical protein
MGPDGLRIQAFQDRRASYSALVTFRNPTAGVL